MSYGEIIMLKPERDRVSDTVIAAPVPSNYIKYPEGTGLLIR